MKKCFKCLLEKPLHMFYQHPGMIDGRVNKCKECNKKDVKENYRKNIDYYREYERLRFQKPERKIKVWEYQKKRRLEQKDKAKAHHMVSNAIRDGKLLKWPCEVCGSEKAEAHHSDYSKPLDVNWLCRKHHLEKHNKKSWKNSLQQKKY